MQPATSLGIEEATPAHSTQVAGAWSRYWARTFDITLWTQFLSIGWGLAVAPVFGGSRPAGLWTPLLERLIEYVALLPVALLVDSLIYSWCGNTPGKALLALSVKRQDGEHLSQDEYRARNFALWLSGLAFGIFILAPVTSVINYWRLKREGYTAWDKPKRYVVVRGRQSVWKIATFVVVMAVWYGLARVAATDIMQQRVLASSQARAPSLPAISAPPRPNPAYKRAPVEPQKAQATETGRRADKEVRTTSRVTGAATPDGRFHMWVNPLTTNPAVFHSQWDLSWRRSEHDNPDGPWALASSTTHEEVLGVFERTDSEMPLLDYAQYVQTDLPSIRVLPRVQKQLRNGRTFVETSGITTMADGSPAFVDFEVFKASGGYWRVWYSAPTGMASAAAEGKAVADAIAQSAPI